MPLKRRIKLFPKFVASTLTKRGWLGITYEEVTKSVSCPNGKIVSHHDNQYTIYFWYYSIDLKRYEQKTGLLSVSFPDTLDFRKYIFFRSNGNYKLSNEFEIKQILDLGRGNVSEIVINNTRKMIDRNKGKITLGSSIFKSIAGDAYEVFKKSQSYKKSAERYYLRLKSQNYFDTTINKTTYIEKDEFKFLVDRLNLETKKKKTDIVKYLSGDDLASIENVVNLMLSLKVCSDEFLRRLNDYIIREKLGEILSIGNSILELKNVELNTPNAKAVISRIGNIKIAKLEGLWQKYFESYLLYLVFTYKKIFPKIQLRNIDGDKKYPDFIGINHYNGLEVIEIKTHLKKILSWDPNHNNFYFTPEMSKAIVQTMNYMDSIVRERFSRDQDKTNITQYTEQENLYHPKGIIVISSLSNLTTKKGKDECLRRDFTKLRNSLHNIEIITFDEILNIANEYVKNVISKETNE